MGDLSGKVAILTGAGRGLGREEALQLAQQGARVVINDINLNHSRSIPRPLPPAAAPMMPAGAEGEALDLGMPASAATATVRGAFHGAIREAAWVARDTGESSFRPALQALPIQHAPGIFDESFGLRLEADLTEAQLDELWADVASLLRQAARAASKCPATA